MLQMTLIWLTRMHKIKMQTPCKVLQIRLRVPQFKTQLRSHKSESGSSPCRSNSSSRSCSSDSSSRSHTGWSEYTHPTTTTTSSYTTGPCWYCSACFPDNLPELDRKETQILRQARRGCRIPSP